VMNPSTLVELARSVDFGPSQCTTDSPWCQKTTSRCILLRNKNTGYMYIILCDRCDKSFITSRSMASRRKIQGVLIVTGGAAMTRIHCAVCSTKLPDEHVSCTHCDLAYKSLCDHAAFYWFVCRNVFGRDIAGIIFGFLGQIE
jgi:protein-arginine kinase activator protein McsA